MRFKYFEIFGRGVLSYLEEAGQISKLLGQIFYWIWRKPSEWKNTIYQMVQIGINSIPVVALTSLSTGMVLALQTGITLERKMAGSTKFIGGMVSLSICRELGPVLTAIIVAGRIGSAIAAEIGSMKVTEQIDALHTMAANPVKYLAVPRLLACLLMLPLLTIFADFIGILGGLLISTTKLDTSTVTYVESIILYLDIYDVVSGLLKTIAFAIIIATVGCYKGFITTGGAEGVGRSTTDSVVVSSILILVSDFILTALLW